MKKLLFLSIITGILLAGCNPNEELYDELDKVTSDAYTDQLEYTLTEGDYSTIADLALANATTAEDSSMIENIDEYGAFADEFMAADYVPAFLADRYVALDEGSVVMVAYNYMGSMETLNQVANTTYYTLTRDDYDSMGEGTDEPGEYNNFAYDVNPDDYLPSFLAGKYPDAEDGDEVAITYEYYSSGQTTERTDFYGYDGSTWVKGDASVSNLYILTAADYDAMGAPGSYNNFSDDVPPGDYLPTFLKNKYPYAKEGDYRYVVYKYYSGYTQTLARKYTFDGDAWKPYVQQSNQFIYGEQGWAFDPTVRFRMTSSDYQMIVDERDSKFVNSYGTGEFYSGADAYYGNFSMVPGDRVEYDPSTFEGLSNDEALEIMWDRILKKADEPMATRGALILLLQKKFPDAVPQVNGLDAMYEVTIDTYFGGGQRGVYTVTYQCTASGDPATFEFVESDAPYSE